MSNNTEAYTKSYSIDVERANYHLKCRKRKIKRFIIVSLIWVLVLIYFVTPLSKVNVKVKGNFYYTKNDITKMAYINNDNYWWLLDTKKAKKVLESYKYIESVKFSKSFLGVKIEIDEIFPVAIRDNKYVMSNNEVIEKTSYDLNSRIENLVNIDSVQQDDVYSLIEKYKCVPLNVMHHFDKIEIIRDSNSYKYVKIYGVDNRIGYFVIKTDWVYLNTKFNENKYDKIIEEVSKNNVKYGEDNPALIAYHDINEEAFELVDSFKEE